jgi:hypothetical protein
MTNTTNHPMQSRVVRAGLMASLAATLAGCTLDATNPGPIQADQLDRPGERCGT